MVISSCVQLEIIEKTVAVGSDSYRFVVCRA